MWVWCNQIFESSPLASSRYTVATFSSWMSFMWLFFPEKLSSHEPPLSFQSPAALTDLSPGALIATFSSSFILSWLVFSWISSQCRLTMRLHEHQCWQKEAGNKRDPGREGKVGEKASQSSFHQPKLLGNSAAIPGFLVSLHIPTLYYSQNGF